MAAARLAVGAFVALLCAGAVMGVAPAQQLATWLEKSAGLSGKKMSTALALCEAKEIETVGELHEVHTKGLLRGLGFMPVALGRIEDALEGVPAPQRRMQDQEPGPACVDVQAEIPRLWAQIGAILAHSQNAALPIGMVIIWAGAAASLPAGWAVCDGSGGTEDLRGRFVLGAGGAHAANSTGGGLAGGVFGFSACVLLDSPRHSYALRCRVLWRIY